MLCVVQLFWSPAVTAVFLNETHQKRKCTRVWLKPDWTLHVWNATIYSSVRSCEVVCYFGFSIVVCSITEDTMVLYLISMVLWDGRLPWFWMWTCSRFHNLASLCFVFCFFSCRVVRRPKANKVEEYDSDDSACYKNEEIPDKVKVSQMVLRVLWTAVLLCA